MSRKFTLAVAAMAAIGLIGDAFADASDYGFVPVNAEIKRGGDVVVAVRLVHKPTDKPVTDAVVFQTRIDMAPDGMADMASPLAPLPSDEPGVYMFKTEIGMPGRWLFSIAAKVQGEPETIVGKVVFTATKQ